MMPPLTSPLEQKIPPVKLPVPQAVVSHCQLEAEAAFTEQQYALELEELQLKWKQEAFARMVRLASLQAEDEVLASTEDQAQTVVSVDYGDV